MAEKYLDDALDARTQVQIRAVMRARASIVAALMEAKESRGLTFADVAKIMGVNKSTVSRDIHRLTNYTMGRLADYGHALGKEVFVDLRDNGDDRTVDLAHHNIAPQTSSGDISVVSNKMVNIKVVGSSVNEASTSTGVSNSVEAVV